MPLMPKRSKHRKFHRRKTTGKTGRGQTIAFGEYGLKSVGGGYVTHTQIEACRVAINRAMKRKGKMWIRIFPDLSRTTKPLETRMGKGKSEPEYYAAVVSAGMVLYEIGGVSEDVARRALARVAHKMPFRCRFITRRHHL